MRYYHLRCLPIRKKHKALLQVPDKDWLEQKRQSQTEEDQLQQAQALLKAFEEEKQTEEIKCFSKQPSKAR